MLSGVGIIGNSGVSLTASAFSAAFGASGTALLFVCVVAFALTTILTYSYYGSKCFGYLFGAGCAKLYGAIYVLSLPVAAAVFLDTAINIIDGCFALMAIPTMLSALWLSHVVMREAKQYFRQMGAVN